MRFLKSRNKAVIRLAGDPAQWESLVKSGIPLSSSLVLDNYTESITEVIDQYQASGKDVDALVELSKGIEDLIQQMPSVSFKHDFSDDEIDSVRKMWFNAIPLSEIAKNKNGQEICVSYFSMTLPWAINAIIRKLYDIDLNEYAEVLEELDLYSEVGVPNIIAIKIYLAGIKSRVTALDLSFVLNNSVESIRKSKLIYLLDKNKEEIELFCSEKTIQWVELFSIGASRDTDKPIPEPFYFKLRGAINSRSLSVRQFDNKLYLCSPDLQDKIEVESSEDLPFELLSNNSKVFFERDGDLWGMTVRGQQ